MERSATTHILDLTGITMPSSQDAGIIREAAAVNPDGDCIGITAGYLTWNGEPWQPISGEIHYSRLDPCRWDDALAKMASAGIDTIATYVFWNHHEEREGVWDFSGCRDLRRFVTACDEHGLHVIVRLGPFCHGEVRNGGLPDWLYGQPYEVRSLDSGFLARVRDLYAHIAAQLDGLYFKDGGPVIAAQVDNEYMASAAPWEQTTESSREWVPGGSDGVAYLDELRRIALDCGIDVPFFTCTGWGAPVPDGMLPLWGGYPYRPWLFYDRAGDHPLTDEYLYRRLHGGHATITKDFNPPYDPAAMPYACCEMGGGMFNSYRYRFRLPWRSVDAMANIKLGSGCTMLGYYMFHGGTNPLGVHGFLNEGQVPQRSYDFQAPLGEFGQMRESYRRLRCLHRFVHDFADRLAPLAVALPDGQADLDPADGDSLRWSVRTDGRIGFVFIDNFQDHATMSRKRGERIALHLSDGTDTVIDDIGLDDQENCILPFNMDLDGVTLVSATAQPVGILSTENGQGPHTYVFLRPQGMTRCHFTFASGVYCDALNGADLRTVAGERKTLGDSHPTDVTVDMPDDRELISFRVRHGKDTARIICVDRVLADCMTLTDGRHLMIAGEKTDIYEHHGDIILETDTTVADVTCLTQPDDDIAGATTRTLHIDFLDHPITLQTRRIHDDRYTVTMPDDLPERFDDDIADLILDIRYQGDIGWLYLDGELISDNFNNGATWQIGLREYAHRLAGRTLTLVITPWKSGSSVNVDSPMAARMEHADDTIAALESISIRTVCRAHINL